MLIHDEYHGKIGRNEIDNGKMRIMAKQMNHHRIECETEYELCVRVRVRVLYLKRNGDGNPSSTRYACNPDNLWIEIEYIIMP